jgi:hypothetical protein
MVAHTSFSRNSTAFLVIVAAIAITSCHKDSNSIVSADPPTPFTGITKTDVTGAVTSADPDDWKSLVSASGGIDPLHPAYPNPCDTSKGCSLAWRMLSADSLLITLNDSPTNRLKTVYNGRLQPGQYTVRVYTSGLAPAIYRVYFKIVRPDTVFTTYGDVQVI